MKKIKIKIPAQKSNSEVIIGSSIINELSSVIDFEKYSKIGLITDENLEEWLPKIEDGIEKDIVEIIIDSGETKKNIDTVQFIWKELLENGFDRKSLIINFGGGVVGDMGGFAASTFMRGIDFIQIPTTLLSQVDASVGGKVGINFLDTKNIIGSFNQPTKVIIDIDTLSSLPKRQLYSGFAEVIKYGLIYDKEFLNFLQTIDLDNITEENYIKIIERSCEIKAEIVKKDEKESSVRKILNFGHTIGHAVESLKLESRNPLLHGEAIAIGMVAEAKISELIGNITQKDLDRIIQILSRFNLPTSVQKINIDNIRVKIISDKKNESGINKWTLLKKIGEASFDNEVSSEIEKRAIEFIIKN